MALLDKAPNVKHIRDKGFRYQVEPSSIADINSAVIQGMIDRGEPTSQSIKGPSNMALLETLSQAPSVDKVGSGRGRGGAEVSFRFDVSELKADEVINFLLANTKRLAENDPDLGWTIDAELTNPTQKAAKALVDMFNEDMREKGFRLATRINETEYQLDATNPYIPATDEDGNPIYVRGGKRRMNPNYVLDADGNRIVVKHGSIDIDVKRVAPDAPDEESESDESDEA